MCSNMGLCLLPVARNFLFNTASSPSKEAPKLSFHVLTELKRGTESVSKSIHRVFRFDLVYLQLNSFYVFVERFFKHKDKCSSK
jgi:hypothetical protein